MPSQHFVKISEGEIRQDGALEKFQKAKWKQLELRKNFRGLNRIRLELRKNFKG